MLRTWITAFACLALCQPALAQVDPNRPLGRAAPPVDKPDDEVTVTGKSRLWSDYEKHKKELERLGKAFALPDPYVSARDQFLGGQDIKYTSTWDNQSHLLDTSKAGVLDAPTREAVRGRSSQN